MRPRRLILLLMVALSAGGCAHSARVVTAHQQPGPTAAPSDLDSIAYSRRTATPTDAYAQASPQLQAQAQTQLRAQEQAYAHAQAQAQAQAQAYARAQAQAKAQAESQARAQAQAQAQAITQAQRAQTQYQAQPGATDARAQVAVVAPSMPEPAYALDTGDKLRVVVFGQDGLSNSYFVDAAGQVTMPLIGAVNARGLTTQQLARAVSEKLRAGFIREPHVAIEVETYRPFFILGEVTQPGQYPYVPNMTVETAVAIAGGYTPRAYRFDVQIDRPAQGGALRSRGSVPLLTRILPGDTILIKERWF